MKKRKNLTIPVIIFIALVYLISAAAEDWDLNSAKFILLASVGTLSITLSVLSWFVIALSDKAKKFSDSKKGGRLIIGVHLLAIICFIMVMNLSPIKTKSGTFCQTIGGETTCYSDDSFDRLLDEYR